MYYNNYIWLLSRLYPSLTWHRRKEKKSLFITFDDGPVPGVTDFVLDTLKEYHAEATFFCVGENVSRNPALFRKILSQGHAVGNHTFNHLNGWKNPDKNYFENTGLCEAAFLSAGELPMLPGKKKLFRPPYGKITRSQIQFLSPEYEIIMWDVLTGDFDNLLAPEKCLELSIRYTRNGSVIIFHDSLKAEKNLRYVLPRFLDHFASLGFSFKKL